VNGWGHAPLVTPEVPSLKYRELRRLVLADGWRKVRQRGSHELYEHPRKHGHVTIAGHDGDDVPLDTLRSVFKQAGLR
jgi:predicted RNA binding protein YcfA (HicA-like mRNA interferase family)